MKNLHGLLAKGDWLIIFIIVALAAASGLPHFLLASNHPAQILIKNDAGVLYQISMDRLAEGSDFNRSFASESGTITFAFDAQKGVCVVQADCPDRLCVHAGYISKPGQMIVCLPGQIYAEIKAEQAGEVGLDATVR